MRLYMHPLLVWYQIESNKHSVAVYLKSSASHAHNEVNRARQVES